MNLRHYEGRQGISRQRPSGGTKIQHHEFDVVISPSPFSVSPSVERPDHWPDNWELLEEDEVQKVQGR